MHVTVACCQEGSDTSTNQLAHLALTNKLQLALISDYAGLSPSGTRPVPEFIIKVAVPCSSLFAPILST